MLQRRKLTFLTRICIYRRDARFRLPLAHRMLSCKVDCLFELLQVVAAMDRVIPAPLLHSQWAVDGVIAAGPHSKGNAALGERLAQFLSF
jgi:hypothetical protein